MGHGALSPHGSGRIRRRLGFQGSGILCEPLRQQAFEKASVFATAVQSLEEALVPVNQSTP